MAIAGSAIAEVPIAAPDEVANTYAVSVSETASAAEVVSSTGTFGETVAEAGSALDTLSVTGTYNVSVGESASAADTVALGGSIFAADVMESGAVTDTVSATGAFGASVVEAAGASDAPSVESQLGLRSRVVFTDVEPSPELQGPGNPGKLKLGLVLTQIYPPIRGFPTR